MFEILRNIPPRKTYTGPTVFLRPPLRSDQKAWIELRDDSRTFLEPWEPAWSADALTPGAFRRRRRRIDQDWRNGVGYGFFIFSNSSNTLLGGITLANVRHGMVSAANIGYWIGRPYARQGYMSEAIQITLDFAFRKLNLHRIEAACLVHNDASRDLLLKSCFQKEGRARKYLCIAGRWQDHDTFGILRTDSRPVVPVIDS